jgi:hypothetical protein
MSNDDSKRWLWIEETAQGPFTVAKMYKMATSREISPTTLFWSDVKQQWFPLPGVMFDIEPSRLDEMTATGIQKVQLLGSGQEDCAACTQIIGEIYPISASPALPPPNCACVPWCRLMIIAAE